MQSIDRPAPQLLRAKVTVTAVFIAHGLVFSSWAAHIPHVKAALGLSDSALGTALFGAPLGSLAATLLSHWALPRWGSHRLIPVTVAGYVVAGATVGLAETAAALPALALVAVLGMSVMLAAASAWVSVLGFAALGVGVVLLVPTAFSAAYGASGAGSTIAIVAATGWLGYLLGPPLIGHLSGRVELSAALVTIPVMMSIVGVAIRCAPAFDKADEFHRDVATPAA
jgi:MFS family permease